METSPPPRDDTGTVLGGKPGPNQLKLKLLTYTLKTFIHLILRLLLHHKNLQKHSCRTSPLTDLKTLGVSDEYPNPDGEFTHPNITQINFHLFVHHRRLRCRRLSVDHFSLKQCFSPLFKHNGCVILSLCRSLTGLSYTKSCFHRIF